MSRSMYVFAALSWLLLHVTPKSARAEGVVPEANQRYPSGTRILFSSFGAAFSIPRGWVGALSPDGDHFVLGAEDVPGFILATGLANTTLGEAKKHLGQPIPVDESTTLSPTEVRAEGTKVTARFSSGAGPQAFVGYAEAVLDPRATAVGFIAVGPSSRQREYEVLIRTLIASLRPISETEARASHGAWRDRLGGRALTYYHTGNGYSERRHLSLCRDGTFLLSRDESYLSNGFSPAGQNGNAGRWQLEGTKLKLAFEDGETAVWSLAASGDGVSVNGQRWFLTQDARCD